MKYCVIDISSTSISLIAAEHDGSEINVSFRDRASLTLVHYMDGRKLSARGVDKLVAAVRVMQEKGRKLGADELYLISTAALRSMENFEEAGKEVLVRTGVSRQFHFGRNGSVLRLRRQYPLQYVSRYRPSGRGRRQHGSVARWTAESGTISISGSFTCTTSLSRASSLRRKRQSASKNIWNIALTRRSSPRKGKFPRWSTVGANANALYDLYTELYGTQEDGVRAMKYKKFKKLTQHLISGHDRSA